MAVNSLLSSAAKAACAMFREAVQVTYAMFDKAKGVAAGLKGVVQFAGQVTGGTSVAAPAIGRTGPPPQQTGRG